MAKPTQNTGVVYLICFDQKFKHARHYLGWTTDLPARLGQHADGVGARLMEVVTEAGITWRTSRIWAGDRRLERKLKNRKGSTRLCPLCAGDQANRRGNYYELQTVHKGSRRSAAEPRS